MKNFLQFFARVTLVIVLFCSCDYPDSIPLPSFPESAREEAGTWTVVVYMAADNDLDPWALDDFREIETAVPSDDVNVLVLLDRSGDTGSRLYHMQPAVEIDCPDLELDMGENTELDMANPYTLSTVLHFARESYPADYYGLIIWGHGTGVRNRPYPASRTVALDDTSGTSMSLSQLATAFSGISLDLIGFDTCFGSTLEQLYELKDSAGYIVGSPGLTTVNGWNYSKLFTLWRNVSPCVAAGLMVASSGQPYTTAVSCAGLEKLISSFETMAQSLAGTLEDAECRQQTMNRILERVELYDTGQYPGDCYLDLYSFARVFQYRDLQTSIEHVCLCSSDQRPGISLFFMTQSGDSSDIPLHPDAYITGGTGDYCRFVREVRGWCPSADHQGGTILDLLFYTE